MKPRSDKRLPIESFDRAVERQVHICKLRRETAPMCWKDTMDYLESEKMICENADFQKLDLICDLYARDQKGLDTKEKEEDKVYRNIYQKLGELLKLEPDSEFMGEMEHSNRGFKAGYFNKIKMLGLVLNEVLKKHFKGDYELKMEEAEEEEETSKIG